MSDAGNFTRSGPDMSGMTVSQLAASPAEPSRNGQHGAFGGLIRRLHFYAGLFVGPFLLVSAVTGVMYTAAPSVAHALHRHELTVEPSGSGRLPLSAQVRAAQEAQPGLQVVSVQPAVDERATSLVVFGGAHCPCAVFVDPYTGQVRGKAKTDGVQLFEAKWVDDLHRTLFLGEFGRNYAELSASWLWVLTLSGLVLWFRRKWSTTGTRRARTRSRHASTGLVLLPVLLFLSASGLSWSLHAGNNIDSLRTALRGANPPLMSQLDQPGPLIAQDQATWPAYVDRVEATARAVGLVDPLVIAVAAKPGSAWTVSDRKRSWPFHDDRVSVNPETGAVVQVSRFADWPFLAKATQWAIAAHMGLLFGWLNQLVLALAGIGLIVMILYGYRMWWLRFRRSDGDLRRCAPPHAPRSASSALRAPRRSAPGISSARIAGKLRSLPPMPSRGALTSLPPNAAVAVVGATLFVGWFLPLFGASLVAFIVIDVMIGLRVRAEPVR